MTASKSSYQIFVSGLKLPIRLGCGPEERRHFQSAKLDLVFEVLASSNSEDLSQSVCYLRASEIAAAHAASTEWVLVENFLDSLCQEFFTRFKACSQVEASLTKFVVPSCEGAGVKVIRKRNED